MNLQSLPESEIQTPTGETRKRIPYTGWLYPPKPSIWGCHRRCSVAPHFPPEWSKIEWWKIPAPRT